MEVQPASTLTSENAPRYTIPRSFLVDDERLNRIDASRSCMERIGETTIGADLPIQRIRSTLECAPVRVAILFGSYATGRFHPRSDIDIAVEFDDFEPGDSEYNETFLGLSADLSATLETDDLDLVDIHSASPSFARSVFDSGVLIVGSDDRVETLRTMLVGDLSSERSPRERFDEALSQIDDHLA